MANPMVTNDATTTMLVRFVPPSAPDSRVRFVVLEMRLSAIVASDGYVESGACASWDLRVAAKSLGGTSSLVGTVATIAEHKDAAASSWNWTIDFDIDGSLRLNVIGASAAPVTWILQGERELLNGTSSVLDRWTEKTV